MTEIFPFIGTRYNSRLIEDMKTVISPSYDNLTPEEREEICRKHPNNILNLIPAGMSHDDENYDNSFLRAASSIQAWRRDGILVNDNSRSFYLYEQRYSQPGGGQRCVRGIYALVSLNRKKHSRISVEGSASYANKSFQLNLLRASKCNFAPIPMFFHDPEEDFEKICREIMSSKPWEHICEDDGNEHLLWVINKKPLVCKIMEVFKKKNCFIMEGHHRYEIARQYRDQQREVTGREDGKQPFDYTLSFLSSFKENSVMTSPVHRVLSTEIGSGVESEEVLEDITEYFNLHPVEINIKKPAESASAILRVLKEKGEKHHAIGMALPDGRAWVMTLKNKSKLDELYDEDLNLSKEAKKLDVSIFYHFIIRQVWVGNPEIELEEDDILYIDDEVMAMDKVTRRKASAAFFLNPCPMKMLMDVVSAGDVIPPFTVRLHPPLTTGLVIRDITIRH